MNKTTDAELKRNVPAPLLALYGLGTILGAGIYVLIGEIAGKAGIYAPLTFLVASIVAAFTAFSFAELAVRVPRSGGPVAYVSTAFGSRWLSITTGWMIAATGIVSAATITTGFAGYFQIFLSWPEIPLMIGLVLLLGAIAAVGMKGTAWFMGITTVAGLSGLIIILVVTAGNFSELPGRLSEAQPLSSTTALSGIVLGAFLAFYAYIGFEDIVHVSEEAKNVSKAMPLAILFALIVSLFFYITVSMGAVLTLSAEALADSKAPLVDVMKAEGYSGNILGALSLFIIVNGALAQIVMASRVFHDMGRHLNGVPKWLSRINHHTHTPLMATLLIVFIIILLVTFLPTEKLAQVTSFIILIVFALSNFALIRLKKQRPTHNGFSVPLWVPYVGATLCILMITGQFFVANASH